MLICQWQCTEEERDRLGLKGHVPSRVTPVSHLSQLFRHLDRVPFSHPPLSCRDMARGVEAVAPLPKVSFVKIDDDTLSKPAGVADNTARGFGCAYFFSITEKA